MSHEANPVAVEMTLTEELREVLERAEQGDRSALPELRRLLDANPRAWQAWGDVAALAEAAGIDLAAGPNLVLKESLARKLAALKAELAGPAPSALERLLIERAVVCWMQAAYGDVTCAQASRGCRRRWPERARSSWR